MRFACKRSDFVGSLSALGSNYGLLVIGKSTALVLLGAAGYWHRQHTLPELDAGRRYAFARLGTVELGVMAVAFGLAAALSRTPPPAAGSPTTDLTESITGYPMPAAPTVSSWFTSWQPDLLWVVVGSPPGEVGGVHVNVLLGGGTNIKVARRR